MKKPGNFQIYPGRVNIFVSRASQMHDMFSIGVFFTIEGSLKDTVNNNQFSKRCLYELPQHGHHLRLNKK